jgi:light-regulated signal transduction histidine kinase (bacteriophytochrome)
VIFSVSSKSKIIKNTEKIFDAYYRESDNIKGFGLGLQLVKNICQEDNVNIDIESTDQLTTFRYKFKMMGE